MRAFIIDPTAYPHGGHNLNSCIRFANHLQSEGYRDITLWIAGEITGIQKLGYK